MRKNNKTFNFINESLKNFTKNSEKSTAKIKVLLKTFVKISVLLGKDSAFVKERSPMKPRCHSVNIFQEINHLELY